MKARRHFRELSEINLGDYIRACAALEAAPETCAAIARLLRLVPEPQPAPPPSPRPPRPDREAPLSGSGVAREESTIGQPGASQPGAPAAEPGVPADPSAPDVPAELTSLPRAPIEIPVANLDDLPADTPLAPSPEIEPLFAPLQTRTLLGRALARIARNGPWDVPRVVERCARGEALAEIPQMPQPALSAGVQLLVDRSDAMMGFAQDVARLERAIRTLVGEDKVRVLSFEGFPARAGKGGKFRWKPYESQLPPPGTVVALIGDLGIGQAAWLPPPAPPARWRDFADTLRRRGCPVVAFVPYPPDRWPAGLRRVIAIIHWDRPTRTSAIRAAVGRRLEVDR